ncbi:MAG: recombinase family protein [bacterium]
MNHQKSRNNVAVYCRLSKETFKDQESISIENQRESLKDYAKHNNWTFFKSYEDDGYSGTNFNRPALLQMKEDIENGLIDIVLVKDLSRLGREHVQTGGLMDFFFPYHNVRFIAVNDNHDSIKANEFSSFKNVVNELYNQDISKKSRFSLNKMMQEPKVLGCGVPIYGYEINDQKQRVLDPNTAPIVKRIFEDYVNGIGTTTIQKNLYDEKIVFPKYYQFLKHGTESKRYSNYVDSDKKYIWSLSTLTRMLRQVEYTGDLINKKYENASFKDKRKLRVPDDKRIHFKKIFEPIVSDELFERANSLMDSQSHSSIPMTMKPYLSLLTCSNCGKELKFAKRPEHLNAPNLYKCTNKKCYNQPYISEDKVKFILEKEIINLNNFILSNETEIVNFTKEKFKNTVKVKTSNSELLTKLQNEILSIDNKISTLVDLHLENKIPHNIYETKFSVLEQEKSILQKTLKTHTSEIPKEIDFNTALNKFLYGLKSINNYNIDRELLLAVFERVEVERLPNKQKNIKVLIRSEVNQILEEYDECKIQSLQSTAESQRMIAI